MLFLLAGCTRRMDGSTLVHAFAWRCQVGGLCVEVQIQQVKQPKRTITTKLWYRAENRSTFQIIAGTYFPIQIDNSMFRISADGRSAVLDHPAAFVTWRVTGDAVRDGQGEYARATAKGIVAGFEIDAANRSNAAGNPLDGAQLDKIQIQVN